MGAARWWARGGKAAEPERTITAAGAAKVAADLSAFGAPKELVERWAGRAVETEDRDEEERLFRVRPDCWKAVQLFARMATQWNWAGAGMAGAERTGLRYETLESTGRLSRIPVTPALFADIQTMELAALGEFGRLAKERAERLERETARGRRRPSC